MPARRAITPPLCAAIASECAAGNPPADVAARHETTEYIVGLIRDNWPTPPDSTAPPPPRETILNKETADPADYARIRRLAAAGWTVHDIVSEFRLTYSQIYFVLRRRALCRALAAGKSLKAASRALGLTAAAARRILGTEPKFYAEQDLRHDEHAVIAPTRCPRCGASLRVLPCRTCRIRAMIAAGERVWPDKPPPAR